MNEKKNQTKTNQTQNGYQSQTKSETTNCR